MTPDAFRQLALGFPGASEAPHFDRIAFKAKTTFATLAGDGSNGMVRVLPLERAEALIASHPDVFFSFGKWTANHGYLGVTLANAEEALVRGLMAESYAHATRKQKKG